ncbi:Oligoxyloglucan reducing end-specific cellobiohydrolase [Periconia macrospinosa]|uniref:Oligoxyloglucan reducing end-specific cellobiohydrolase n=1 Tax=Periconia macrospinosa TaxID=97972 RepID=A0A2V1ECS5_9PLEO|nr:Oligoxyloglucan reducing end-specific cellobiohydrolase [Periconia macrospinosa]
MQLLHQIYLAALTIPGYTTALPASPYQPSVPHLTWSLKSTNSTQQFRGLSPVSDKVVWVSGTSGTVLRTTNGGSSWSNISPSFAPENATNFQFRDIHAWSAESAVVLSIGEGDLSRIYVTSDGGKNWSKTFVNEEPAAFYDCLAFEDEKHGLAMSDPVEGKFRLIETWDGGATWDIVDPQGIPAALTGEFGFAASGTCIEAAAGRWYIASGGVDPGRVYGSSDGHEWKVSNTSIPGGPAAGVFSVRFRDEKYGIAVGGDYEKPTGNVDNAAWSEDSGATWKKAESFPGGYRSGASWVPGRSHVAIAVGTSGSDITVDGGKNWHSIGNGTFDAVECVKEGVCWASGAQGRVASLSYKHNV